MKSVSASAFASASASAFASAFTSASASVFMCAVGVRLCVPVYPCART